MRIVRNYHTFKKNIVFNAIWLFVAFLLLLSTVHRSSFSWLYNKKTADVNTESFLKVHAAEGLRMGYSGSKFLTSPISICDVGNFLSECTSVDGKNIFFPVSEYTKQNYGSGSLVGDGEAYNNANTQDFLFRKANANDKNKKYISIDFTLSSDINTGVWLSNDSQIIGTAKDAVRVSISKNDETDPIVLDSSIGSYSNTENVVSSITAEGSISSTGVQISKAISNYSFTNEEDGRQLFTIEAGKTLNLTLTIWLEGADVNCVNDIFSTSDLSINIKFVRDIENPQYIYFIDDTATKWISDGNNEMYVYDKNTEYTYKMTKSDSYSADYTWIGKIPQATTQVMFIRRTAEDDTASLTWDAKNCTGNSDEYHALGKGINGGLWIKNAAFTDFYFTDATSTQWISANDADISVSFPATDSNNGSTTVAYFLDCINVHPSLPNQTTYLGKTNYRLIHTFTRYVNDGSTSTHSWRGIKLNNTLFKVTGTETSNTGSWSTMPS